MLFWLQPELATAVERWPVLFEREPSAYHHDLERQRDLQSGTCLQAVDNSPVPEAGGSRF